MIYVERIHSINLIDHLSLLFEVQRRKIFFYSLLMHKKLWSSTWSIRLIEKKTHVHPSQIESLIASKWRWTSTRIRSDSFRQKKIFHLQIIFRNLQMTRTVRAFLDLLINWNELHYCVTCGSDDRLIISQKYLCNRLDDWQIRDQTGKTMENFVTYQHTDNFWIRMADKQRLVDKITLCLVLLVSRQRSRISFSSSIKQKRKKISTESVQDQSDHMREHYRIHVICRGQSLSII